MTKFIYRMQSILDVKLKLEEQAKQHYMEVRLRLNEAVDDLEALHRRKEFYFENYRKLLMQRLDKIEIEGCKNSILIMDEYIERQNEVIHRIEQELEQAALAMQEAMKERKVHEKLKEKQYEVFLQEMNQEEAKEIDQLVSYQYNNRDTEED